MMKAAVLEHTGALATLPLTLRQQPMPKPESDEVLIRVRACGVCRTDLHIVTGELPMHRANLIPGHQIVGTVVATGAATTLAVGVRVGVAWLGGTDGSCHYCHANRENLCDHPIFTGYDRNGGYAEYVTARGDFCYLIDDALDDVMVAPLLCAGIIGFRALRVAGVQPGEHVGLFGFGASAHLALPVLQAWGCQISVATREEGHRAFARELHADWVGDALENPPTPLDRAITFAPSGEVVVAALRSLRKGGVVAINAIHLDRIPEFDYDTLLWGEREIRSVTNMTRQDASDFLALAAKLKLRPHTTTFALDRINEALLAIQDDRVNGAAVILIDADVPLPGQGISNTEIC